MNRPGQPQQRAPNLTANPALSSQFRPSYPTYGMPPRTVLQAGSGYVPSLQPNSHRTTTQQAQVQVLTGQPSQGFNQPRGQSSFAFGGGALGQHQPSTVLQQQQPLPSQQQQQQQQQQPQTNGTPNTISSLLGQTSVMGATPAVSSATEVSLDPNDFPALGSAPANPNPSSSNNGSAAGTATSYATQAGTGVLLGGTGGSGSAIGSSLTGAQTRDFTPDDFPALGGQPQTAQQSREPLQNQLSSQENLSHPPGLNGFPSSEQQQLRQSILGAGLQQSTPGMLNLGPTQSRNIHPGFQQGQTEAEKQQQRNNYSLKLNQASHAAWNSPNANPNTQSQQQPGGVAGSNGTFSQNLSTNAPGAIANPTAPPTSGPPPFSSNGLNPGESHTNPSIPNPNGSSNPIPTASNNVNPPTLQTSSTSHLQHPQTPAQQVLISAADRWGLLSLIAMMRNSNADADHGLSSIGADLGTMGLDMGFPGNLYSTFITPWADQSAARTVEPDFHLPACYLSVQAPPPGPAKAAMFSDETLFYMFYSSPRDALQEVAAQELWNRNWRYHKDLRLWITKESGTSPSQKVQGGVGEQGLYTFWDTENWVKERKEMTVLYADLEEKSVAAFMPGAGLVLQAAAQPQTGSQQPVQLPSQPQLSTRGTFQMGMAGL
ncbi:hypothetical protein GALMADRAFT_237941 [Galerina marginata CBS 339.88]|uniref:NOT2/NOT3/NOT5 C-terminal domain-containing protein n=1 Tax=Galerina marginata (strain CBS 339.88) TaxID=685588 RepID=A0A067TRN0_GALM3|nr:hypothetical protein GALMADRAFT_237941 [Galerina marginata CBS 339.88]